MMDYHTVFASASGLTPPWEVIEIRFSLEEHQLDVWVDFPPGSTFACPTCGRAGAKVHDTGYQHKILRNLMIYESKKLAQILHYDVALDDCPALRPWSNALNIRHSLPTTQF